MNKYTWKEKVISLRRQFHENPELSGQEHETSKIVQEILKNEGIHFETGYAKTGVLGIIEGGKTGGTIALRADMDALPIIERTDIDFQSKNAGVMHACGHDAHTAMLLCTALRLNEIKESLQGTVLLVFQPAEESSPIGGAGPMLEDGIFAKYRPDAIFGQHVWPNLAVGEIGIRDKEMMGASDSIRITINGEGGHASMPHQGKDAIVIAAELISAIQSIVSRNTDPLEAAVITIGTISGGYRYNVIADQVKLEGTVRTYKESIKEVIKSRLVQLIKGFEVAYGISIDFAYTDGYNATVNTPEWAQFVRSRVVSMLGETAVPTVNASLGGEDFSRFLKEIPGAFYWLGCAREGVEVQRPLHDAEFYLNEECLELGVDLMTDVAIQALSTIEEKGSNEK